MLLTVSKRLEFSASRRLFVPKWSEQENLAAFGPETRARHGSGRNYTAYFVFTGPVDPATGMLINISEIKERAGEVVRERFDHKFLNEDNSLFGEIVPTAENIARELYLEVGSLFSGGVAQLVACHLTESPERSATFYSNGVCEANYWFDFSAARRTMSPWLSTEENARLFGPATSIHGHNYRARLTYRSPKSWGVQAAPVIAYTAITDCLRGLRKELDHRYLNEEVAGLAQRPVTTESLANYIHQQARATTPLDRIRLHETADFFAEAWKEPVVFLGVRMGFYAAHRLCASTLSDAENAKLYGKCNNPLGHGHGYETETTIGGEYDERSGTLYDFVALSRAIHKSLEPWLDRHLDLETEDFRNVPSTGENIVRALWPKIDHRVGQRLVRLRLWETPNNRFTLRRT
ncbi:MAG TPA: 6-carboxytetrahydropterin synthase [Candidatus Udaeobacter sp.]|jgi:6-pyruvoyltetrahydropterin/6-carboxytetrahydropterin synthase|nr:6-carboxytetrahydropterin synthase [Candidatus Udaeobacter sp.]